MEKFLKIKSASTSETESNLDDLPWDPAKRKKILEYHPNKRDEYANWLEYSVSRDKAFCLCCYLFRDDIQKQGGNDAFVTEGFSSWNKSERLAIHVGAMNSFHNIAVKKCDSLMNQNHSIEHAFYKQDDVAKNEYRIRLNASIDASRYLLRQGLSFRAHDESVESDNKGNFKQLLKYTAEQNEVVGKVALENAPKNNQMTSPPIQKDIVHCFAEEVVKSIIEEIDHGVFGLLVDESADVSHKEQMAVVFRFVDKIGTIKERFIGVVHVRDTSSLTLKHAIDDLFAKYGLSLKNIRGQGYDGASNMKGEFNGLRSLILRENSSGYYVHCFAHQLQLVVVAIAKKHFEVGDFFDKISTMLNVVGASCKRKDKFQEIYRKEIEKEINDGEISTGKGKNQDRSLPRPAATRWGSHHKTLFRLVELFSIVTKVLKFIQTEGIEDSKKRQAYGLANYLHTFDCVFYMHFMLHILGLTENLSMALQTKDQDILNAVSLVESTKRELQKFRDDGWDSLMVKVHSFCKKHDVDMVMIEDEFVDFRRPRKRTNTTNLQYYKISCFNFVLDLQLQEFNDRFTEVNTQLLICMASLSPTSSFKQFDKDKLMKLVEFYPDDFTSVERFSLEQQFDIYIDNVKEDKRFSNLKSLGDLSRLMVETQKHLALPLIYRLLKLVLTLPVATATVEMFFCNEVCENNFSQSNWRSIFKRLSCLFIEKELFESVTNETVMKRFQTMAQCRVCL
ncbi:hypothetical protein EUTSA_v10028186mg [Eutrema salsugineum]|uniref:TTF-type domain-containing protein n=1 Tax=Eutrema salsugineum TaxID=72664 RepID=V4LSS6_EUTSA|nr:hypothetical protein EUTSA_v10028186mg [Eutrema salsugineum]